MKQKNKNNTNKNNTNNTKHSALPLHDSNHSPVHIPFIISHSIRNIPSPFYIGRNNHKTLPCI